MLLDSGRDDGSTFAFVAALNGEGETLWAQQAGQSGDTRANALALQPDGGLAIGGFFNDTTRFGEARFTANTFDPDAFLASYGAGGSFRWARKAGGVIDDEIRALAAGPDGAIYATGAMVGVMALSEEIVLQTTTGNPDFFLLKYDAGGTPLYGRALGGAPIQSGLDIEVQGELVAICGVFSGALSLDGLSVAGGQAANGFIAGFNTQGEARWLVSVPSEAASLASCLDITAGGSVLVGGSYAQHAVFDGTTLTATGSTGVFAGQLSPALTPVPEFPGQGLDVKIFPNPGRGRAFLYPEGLPYAILLYDEQGRLLRHWQNRDELQLEGLPAGLYTVVIGLKDKRKVLRLVLY